MLSGIRPQDLGPVRHADMAAVRSCNFDLCGAVLDTRLGRDESWAIADLLWSRNIPFAFLTSVPGEQIPPRFHGIPVVQKPYRPGDLWAALSSVMDGRAAMPGSAAGTRIA